MKTIAVHLLTVLACSTAFAHENAKGAKKEPGPNGGRIIETVNPHLEFFVTKDRKVEITSLDKDHKTMPLSGQVIAVTAGERSNPTRLEFKEDGGKLVSTNALPEGNDFPVSVSIKASASGKAVYEKFNLNLEKCPTCKYAEYACICAHSGDNKDEKK